MKQAMLMLACFLVGFPLWGQYNLSGTVRNAKGETLAGAAVAIKNSYLGTTTGSLGNYVLEGLQPGQAVVQVSYLGYATQAATIEAGTDKILDFVLEPSSFLENDVVVKATRMSGNESVARIQMGRDALSSMNSGQDMPFILALSPSLIATSDAGTGIGYTNLRIRGTDSYRINVTVNGIPVNDPESHGVWWVNMPDFASSADNIQVQRGVGASTNGAAAFGGSVNMQTAAFRDKPYASISLDGGAFNTFRRNVMLGSGLVKNHFTFDMRLSKLDSDGYIERAFTHLKSWYVSGAHYGHGSILRFNIFSGDEQTYQAWWGIDKSILDINRRYNPYSYDNETDNYTQTHYQLLYSKALHENLYLNTALHYTHGEGYYENYQDGASLAEYNLDPLDGRTSSDLITRKWMDNDFYGMTYSLHYRRQKYELLLGGGWNNFIGNHFGQVIWAAWAGNNKIRHEYYRNQGVKADINHYLKCTYRITDRFSLFADLQYRYMHYWIDGKDDIRDTAGVQVQLDQKHLFHFINPKAGLFYQISSHQDFYLTFATGRREPTRTNFVDATLQSEKPKPETLYDLEAGSSYKSEGLRTNLNVFYMYYFNQLVHTGKLNDVAYPIMINVPKSFRLGLELVNSFQPVKYINWESGITISKNKILDFVEYASYEDADHNDLGVLPRSLGNTDISYSPDFTAFSSLAFKPIAPLEFSLLSRYVGRQYFDNTSSPDRMLDPYFVNDLNMNWMIKPGFVESARIHLQINNIFNVEYESNAYGGNWYEDGKEKSWSCWFPQAGIHIMAGLTVEF